MTTVPTDRPARPYPRLSAARATLTRTVTVRDADGTERQLLIPRERALTLYVDGRELVTLMTLGQSPELLALGYLLNQQLVTDVREVDSVDVDWEVEAAALRTHAGVAAWEQRLSRRIVTSGCGQGTVFGGVMEAVLGRGLPAASSFRPLIGRDPLARLLEAMREAPSVHREAGSVHGTALWQRGAADAGRQDWQRLVHVEDVGRHNAIDTVAGWMAMQGRTGGGDQLLYTTGRLTSEMVLKAAWLGVPVVVSRNGITAMGHELAERLNVTLVGRASGTRWIVYTHPARIGTGD